MTHTAEKITVDLAIIGAGPAGLAAAVAAYDSGVRDILLLERDKEPGGILNQCIHNGFGLHVFGEELTGPQYAERFVRQAAERGIPIRLQTMVLDIEAPAPRKGAPFRLHVLGPQFGDQTVEAKSVILAMGCRERTRGAIGIPGDRPSGVFTAGTAQRLINREGFSVGKRAVILGSGDIGLIMARRLTLEGAKVLCVVELMPYSNGLARNIAQCLNDFNIPLYLSHTVTDIKGHGRLEEVTISEVDANRAPIPGTEKTYPCDTLLLSVGLIPENELTRLAGAAIDPRTGGPLVSEDRQTSIPGLFACGNVLHVHDLVDFVTGEASRAGKGAAAYLAGDGRAAEEESVGFIPGRGISYTVPHMVDRAGAPQSFTVFMRVRQPKPDGVIVMKDAEGTVVKRWKRPRLAPAEMEELTVTREMIASGGSYTFEVEE